MKAYEFNNATVERLLVSDATSGDSTIIPARAGAKIVVLSGLLVAAGAVNITFKSGTNAITGVMTMATGVPFPISSERYGFIETASGELLALTLSGNVQVSGTLNYVYVTDDYN